MADYIYLLQYRLTPTQRRAVEAVRQAAREVAMPVFLVGGAVRDLTSGAPVRDLDFALQGDVASLQPILEAAGAGFAGEDALFLSRYFVFPGGVRVEVGSTLSVSYPQPGKPEVQPATILDDLRRRDFTANAMAISLNEGSFGLLLDPLNGVADLENRELRLVSGLGFIEQPALLLRAARLSSRMGWTLEDRTQKRYENAKEEGAIERLPLAARGYELEEVFHEEDPIAVLEHLEAEGWLQTLAAPLVGLKMDREALDRVRDVLGQMEHLGIFTDPSPVYFPLLTSRLQAADLAAIKTSFPRDGFVRQIDTLEARSKDLASQMGSKSAALPSATWKLLMAAEPEILLALATTTRTTALQAKFKAFFTEWPGMRQRIPYALLQEMRIAPEIEGYNQLLEDLSFALMDGKLNTTDELRAFLEPYSPPAPVQAPTVRRRAAKATRGRGRQAAAPAATAEVEPSDLAEPDTSSDEEEMDTASPPDSDEAYEDSEVEESDPLPAAPKVPPATSQGTVISRGSAPSPGASASVGKTAAVKQSKKMASLDLAPEKKTAVEVVAKSAQKPISPESPAKKPAEPIRLAAGPDQKKEAAKGEINKAPASRRTAAIPDSDSKKLPPKDASVAASKQLPAKVAAKSATAPVVKKAVAKPVQVVVVKPAKAPVEVAAPPPKPATKQAGKAASAKSVAAKTSKR